MGAAGEMLRILRMPIRVYNFGIRAHCNLRLYRTVCFTLQSPIPRINFAPHHQQKPRCSALELGVARPVQWLRAAGQGDAVNLRTIMGQLHQGVLGAPQGQQTCWPSRDQLPGHTIINLVAGGGPSLAGPASPAVRR